MLGTLPIESKKEWQGWVSTMTHPYNCTISHATGYKPYYLMYGCEPRLAIDVEYGVTMPTLTKNIRHIYVKKIQARLKWAFGNAMDFNRKEMNHHKQYYDRKVKGMALCPDDIVLVQVKAFGNDQKDKWEQSPYLVVEQMSDKPVFKIRPLDSTGDSRDRILHRNMLFPLQSKVQTDVVEATAVLSKANQLMDLYFNI